jgi:hypothetical protein
VRNERLLVIGYGSLMSGYGLLALRRGGRSGALTAIDAHPIELLNARRGLAKPSSHGSYLAMDIEPVDRAIAMRARAAAGQSAGVGAMLLTFDRGAAPEIARREEYDPAAFVRLIEIADRAGAALGEFLAEVAQRVSHDPAAYRTRLREILGYTSKGYIFHPIELDDGRVAIIAVGSGFDSSGDPDVISRRREFGIDRLMGLGEALALESMPIDRAGQIGYAAECLLGAIHGISVADLMAEYHDASARGEPWAAELANRLGESARDERERFVGAVSLNRDRYRERFGERAHPSIAPLLRRAALI